MKAAFVTLPISLGLLVAAEKAYPPYFEDLNWQDPRTLSNWSNLTVETRTGTFIGMLNDTFPDVRQFLRIPFAQVRFSVTQHGQIFSIHSSE